MQRQFITFGEVMMRLNTKGDERIRTAAEYEVRFGGGEYNVAVSLANYGIPSQIVTRLPDNDLGDACLGKIRENGVGTEYIQRGGDRLGLYFLEKGYAQRPSKVVYDRAGSAFANCAPDMFAWKNIFSGKNWFHFTGITPAISLSCAAACLKAAETAKDEGCMVSCDLNYRKKLWKWTSNPTAEMEKLVKQCDLLIGNEEDAEKYFGIHAPGSDITNARVEADSYAYVCEELKQRFPNLKYIAITLRGSISASRNTWTAVLWSEGKLYQTTTYDIFPVVDRVGGGDSFAGGLIYGLISKELNLQYALDFAVAASCLKHSVPGDVNRFNTAEVEQLMLGDGSGRVSR